MRRANKIFFSDTFADAQGAGPSRCCNGRTITAALNRSETYIFLYRRTLEDDVKQHLMTSQRRRHRLHPPPPFRNTPARISPHAAAPTAAPPRCAACPVPDPPIPSCAP
jgi:hypothetical protein